MKKKLQTVLTAVFVVGCVAFFVWWNATKPRILVLHSYDRDYFWTREIDVALHRVFDRRNSYSIRWHYMNTKRNPWEDYVVRAGLGARDVVDEWRPDLVIAVDDEAQEQVMKHYVNRARMHIVFAGINGEIAPYGYADASNVTGILERIPWSAIKDALLASGLARSKPELRLLHLGDATQAVREDARQMQQFDWAPMKLAGVRTVGSFEQWKAEVLLAPQVADVILLGNYRGLTDAADSMRLVDPAQVVAWTEANSKLPVIGFKVAYGEEGGALAIAASPYEQGEAAARMAIRILDSRIPPSQIPVASTRQFVVSIDGAALAARGIGLPSFYESFARATNTYR